MNAITNKTITETIERINYNKDVFTVERFPLISAKESIRVSKTIKDKDFKNIDNGVVKNFWIFEIDYYEPYSLRLLENILSDKKEVLPSWLYYPETYSETSFDVSDRFVDIVRLGIFESSNKNTTVWDTFNEYKENLRILLNNLDQTIIHKHLKCLVGYEKIHLKIKNNKIKTFKKGDIDEIIELYKTMIYCLSPLLKKDIINPYLQYKALYKHNLAIKVNGDFGKLNNYADTEKLINIDTIDIKNTNPITDGFIEYSLHPKTIEGGEVRVFERRSELPKKTISTNDDFLKWLVTDISYLRLVQSQTTLHEINNLLKVKLKEVFNNKVNISGDKESIYLEETNAATKDVLLKVSIDTSIVREDNNDIFVKFKLTVNGAHYQYHCCPINKLNLNNVVDCTKFLFSKNDILRDSIASKILKDFGINSYNKSSISTSNVLPNESVKEEEEVFTIALSIIPNSNKDRDLLYLVKTTYNKGDDICSDFSKTYKTCKLGELNADIVRVFYPEDTQESEKTSKLDRFRRLVRVLSNSL